MQSDNLMLYLCLFAHLTGANCSVRPFEPNIMGQGTTDTVLC
jgi:hypothetical protein